MTNYFPLEQQVCGLEYSKKLKELGVKQVSLWYWVAHKEYPNKFVLALKGMHDLKLRWYLPNGELGRVGEENRDDFTGYSAFTVAESGKALKDIPLEMTYSKKIGYRLFDKRHWEFVTTDTEANVKAKLRIHLIKKGLINAQ